jgi:hypothetical protein
MPKKSPQLTPSSFNFKIYTDGCDDALDIYRTGRKRPLASLRYWTAAGLTIPLAEQFAKHPGLLAAGKQLLAEMEADLASADPRVRYPVEREAPLFVGLWAAIAQAERDTGL